MRLLPRGGKPVKERPISFAAFFVCRQETRSINEGYRRCCGMDIHKDTVVVCALPPVGGNGQDRLLAKTDESRDFHPASVPKAAV
jgi:hypothetical protein